MEREKAVTPREDIDLGVATMSLMGEPVSGDLHLVETTKSGLFLAVVDGLGHGPEAAKAAEIAVACLQKNLDIPLVMMVRQCHRALRQTRGVVMTLALLEIDTNRLNWLGIGNVEARLMSRGANGSLIEESLLLRGGIVGHSLPSTLSASTSDLRANDLIILATDGISSDFTQGLFAGRAAQQIADDIMAHHHKGTDDALVLVAKVKGGAP